VKTDSNRIISYASKADYLARKPIEAKAISGMNMDTVKEGAKTLAQDSAEVSNEAKALQNANGEKGKLKDEIKEKAKELPKKVKDKVLEGKDAGSHLLSQAGGALLRGVSSLGIPGISVPDVELKTEAPKTEAPK